MGGEVVERTDQLVVMDVTLVTEVMVDGRGRRDIVVIETLVTSFFDGVEEENVGSRGDTWDTCDGCDIFFRWGIRNI